LTDTKIHPIIKKRNLTPGTPEAVLKVAEYFVQIKYEEGPNKDNLFGKWFGANNTHWCAEFVSYCFNKAGAGHVVNGLQTRNGYLSCSKGIAAMKKRGLKQIPVAEAQPGDIIFFDWDHDHDPDHTGIVVKNNPKKKQIVCREGNTSRGDGSRSNGGQVAERVRNYSNVFIVFRPNWKVASQPIVEVKKTEIKKIEAQPIVVAEPAKTQLIQPQTKVAPPKSGGMLPE
jgi:hypothetical protein